MCFHTLILIKRYLCHNLVTTADDSYNSFDFCASFHVFIYKSLGENI